MEASRNLEPFESLDSLVTDLFHDLRVERRQPSPSRRPPLEHLPLPPSIYDKAALALSEPSREEITYVKVDPPARPSIRAISTSSPVTLPHASQEATSSTDSNISLVAKQTALFESISKSTSQDQSPWTCTTCAEQRRCRHSLLWP